MNQELRLGEPVELSWWVFALAAPPAVVFGLSFILAAPVWARGLGALSSVAMIAGLVRASTRVESKNLQSVWVSLGLAIWFFCATTWVVAVATAGR